MSIDTPGFTVIGYKNKEMDEISRLPVALAARGRAGAPAGGGVSGDPVPPISVPTRSPPPARPPIVGGGMRGAWVAL